MSIFDYDTNPNNNTTIGGIAIGEGNTPSSNLNDALRQLMADLATFRDSLNIGEVKWLAFDLLTFDATARVVPCDGRALDSITNTEYAPLFARIGTSHGGTGAANFNVPDLRGRGVAGLDNIGGVAANRLTSGVAGFDPTVLGTAGGDQLAQAHTHTVANTGGSVNDVDEVNANSPEHYLRVPTVGTTSQPSGSKHGGDSGNVQPTMVMFAFIGY